MSPSLQLGMAPLAALLTLWAAVIALALEANAPLPRMLAARPDMVSGTVSPARGLHVIHLALLAAAGAVAATSVAWWAHSTTEAVPRFLLATFLVWLVGDLLPRVLAALAPELVRATEGAAGVTLRVFRPLLRLVAWSDLGGRRAAIDELRARPAGGDREMLNGVFALREMTVAEVMTPRIDIVAVDQGDDRASVVERFRRSGHSRLLVRDGHFDAIVGLLHAKDLLPGLPVNGGDWHALIRPGTFVPEAKTLAEQLRDFQRGPSHLAVVVDEFGGTAGLVTLEDILEQIVGEIRDEYDVDEVVPIQQTAPGRWLVQGGVPLADLEAHLDSAFEREDVDTVGGLVLAVLGRVPRVGETVAVGAYRLIVDQVVRRRVGRVVVEAASPAPTPEEAEAP